MIPARHLPLVLMLILGNLWGLSFSLSKTVVLGGIHPLAYVWMQTTGATLFLFVICRRAGVTVPTSRRHLLLYGATGLVGTVLPSLTIVTTALHVPAGIISTLVTTVPMLTFALAVSTGLQRFQPMALAGLTLGLIGVLFLVVPDSSLPSADMAGWVLFGLLTPVFYATNGILAARLRPAGTSSLAAALGMMATASVTSLPIMLATGTFHPLFAEGLTPHDLAMTGQIVITCVAYIMYFEINERSGPVYLSQVSYVVNVSGLFWGYAIFGEVPSPWLWATVVLVFAGVYLVNRTTRAETPS
ncbi:DMT family transporter [Thalassobaculum sp. OXR-137]|uniref:DMT family transporter n=1 Tax=Thalassobaculum sp. OXR-137 TaxID=3100173 RepID=UPI002AC93C63|nr:DMT family transporter [Thalassobaculum sp. OXR-137]WPZ35235.1 DMT family transporter [Thalassobaculum sp. OXR-137]